MTRRPTIILHGSTSQKTILNFCLTFIIFSLGRRQTVSPWLSRRHNHWAVHSLRPALWGQRHVATREWRPVEEDIRRSWTQCHQNDARTALAPAIHSLKVWFHLSLSHTEIPRVTLLKQSAKRALYFPKNSCEFGYFRSFQWPMYIVTLLVTQYANIMSQLKSQNMD
jgi:hypothetical protein